MFSTHNWIFLGLVAIQIFCGGCQSAPSADKELRVAEKIVVFPMDSTDAKGNHFEEKIKEYHGNGRLKALYYQGTYNCTGCFVGLYKKFDASGELIESIQIHNDSFDEAYLLYSYYKDGQLVDRKKVKNHFLYEIEENVPFVKTDRNL